MQSLQSAESELWIDRTAANDIKVAKHSFPAASNTVKEQCYNPSFLNLIIAKFKQS